MTTRLRLAVTVAVACGTVLAAQVPQSPGSEQARPAPAPVPVQDSGVGAADPPQVTFRVEVDYVEVDATVIDAQGSVVTDLGRDEFEVFEDGRRQTVTAFSRVNIPIERDDRPLFTQAPVELDVQSNRHVEGRMYLIVLDDMHTDASRAGRVKAAARRFIEQNFGRNDLAAVAYTGGRGADSQDFTNNPRLLLAAIDRFTGRKLRSATLERLDRVVPSLDGSLIVPPDPAEFERAHRARSAMATIRRLSEFMAGVRGRRKAMLLIGEGIEYDIHEATGPSGATASAVLMDTHEAIAAATRGNVVIYAIDPRGLVTGAEDLIESASTFPEQGAGLPSMQNELRLSQDGLRVLASSTGGFAAVNQNELERAFDRIVAENSTYYVLGYYPTNDRRDGRFRRIEVHVKRPGLRVRARNGYFEPRGRRSDAPAPARSALPAVSAALSSPIPLAGLSMQVFAAAFKGEAPNAAVAVAVELDASRLDLAEKGGTFAEQLEVAYTATDAHGKVFPGERHAINLALKPDTYERVRRHGLRLVTQVNLPPGRYQLRVAAGNRTGKSGSVLYDLDVPDFRQLPWSMSGVALTAASAGAVATITPRDPLAGFLPAPPTTAREFDRGDELALFAEFYEHMPGAPPHQVEFRAELRAEGGRVAREVAEERSSTELQGRSGGYGFAARLPLDGLDPGLYVLHVEGRSRAGAQPAASRDIQIRIR
jgi:VWFA-related protein